MRVVKEKLRIIGVDCPACVYSINKELSRLKGIIKVDISAIDGTAIIEYDEDLVGLREIADAIRRAGYDVEKNHLTLTLPIDEEAIPQVEERISGLRGVFLCRASPVTKTAKISFNPYSISREELLSELRRLGLSYEEVSAEKIKTELEEKEERKQLWVLIAFALGLFAVVYHSVGMLYKQPPLWEYRGELLFAVATVVLALSRDTVTNGFKSLFKLTPTMESLIALSATSTYMISLVVLASRPGSQEVFFKASAGVLGFVGLGKYLEARIKSKALSLIRMFEESQVSQARLIINNEARQVSVSEVRPGDVIEVKAGEVIPLDGVVVKGWGYVDESMLTGESRPVYKSEERRDPVYAGSTLINGYIRVRVTRTGEDTVLSRIIEAVREAQYIKPRYQMLADRLVGRLTWGVIALSIGTFTYWLLAGETLFKSTIFMASVLAITCPCPLGIAIPLATSLGTYISIKKGLVIKRGDVFERILEVRRVYFDKTGTLTTGSPVLEDIVIKSNELSREELMMLVCSAERRSEHPLSRAVMSICESTGMITVEPERYDNLQGLGIVSVINSHQVVIGTERLIENMGIAISDEDKEEIAELSGRGYTVSLVAVDNTYAGYLVFRDKIREDSRELIEYLRRKGLVTGILTGDRWEHARLISRELGVDEVHAELTPEEKAAIIEEKARSNEKVMYIGDGINDAIAISKAHVGVAVSNASDIAKQAGDVVVTSASLLSIKELFELSKAVMSKAKTNLAWAFIYNLTLIPIAMGALYKPLGIMLMPEQAAIAMILSDISVVLNSTTLLKHLGRAHEKKESLT
ncbi:MAG: heavy metal translocating P-type ATPase [Fervidicoccaceae archaeon]